MTDKKLMYIGRVTAGMTHEINNVLAIVRESAGLMEDLLEIDQQKHAKLEQALVNIREQAIRGTELTGALNGLGHAADGTVQGMDVDAFVSQTALLLGRWAKLKQVSLKPVFSGRSDRLDADPLLLQMVIDGCLAALLDRSRPGGLILIGALPDLPGLALQLSVEGKEDFSSVGTGGTLADLPEIGDILEMIGARVAVFGEEARPGFAVLLA